MRVGGRVAFGASVNLSDFDGVSATMIRIGELGTVTWRDEETGEVKIRLDRLHPELLATSNTVSILPGECPELERAVVKLAAKVEVPELVKRRRATTEPHEETHIEWAYRVTPNHEVDPLKAAFSSLATLFISVPMAMLLSATPLQGHGPGSMIFTIGVVWATTRYGWRGGLPLAMATIVAHNLFVVEPVFHFTNLQPIEILHLWAWTFISFIREFAALYEARVRPVIVRFLKG